MSDQQASGKWVLVAGTGVVDASQLPVEAAWAAVEVSRALARAGHSLVTGDWPGVDELSAQTFAAELRSAGVPVKSRLKQVVSEDEPYEKLVEGADVERPDTMFDANLSKLGLADFVVLIGGVGGTLKMFRGAQLVKKPAFPIAGTGGDAEEAFKDILSGWYDRPVESVSLEEFSRLGKPIKAEEDAREVAADLVSLINKITGQQVKPPEPVCLILTPDDKRFERVRDVVTETLKGAGVRPLTTDPAAGRLETGPPPHKSPVERADFIIADITSGRPNVMYELGFAHALRKPVFRIIERVEGEVIPGLSQDADYAYDPARINTDLTPKILDWIGRNQGISK
ncbi:MAG TPA: hypothetical protein VN282_28035 [Pyrinomonadaceae bacterium]|nr:hypothetical protein [Pyrinomonadaceae bacterium]